MIVLAIVLLGAAIVTLMVRQFRRTTDEYAEFVERSWSRRQILIPPGPIRKQLHRLSPLIGEKYVVIEDGLTEDGLPQGWSRVLAGFKTREAADREAERLRLAGRRARSESISDKKD